MSLPGVRLHGDGEVAVLGGEERDQAPVPGDELIGVQVAVLAQDAAEARAGVAVHEGGNRAIHKPRAEGVVEEAVVVAAWAAVLPAAVKERPAISVRPAIERFLRRSGRHLALEIQPPGHVAHLRIHEHRVVIPRGGMHGPHGAQRVGSYRNFAVRVIGLPVRQPLDFARDDAGPGRFDETVAAVGDNGVGGGLADFADRRAEVSYELLRRAAPEVAVIGLVPDLDEARVFGVALDRGAGEPPQGLLAWRIAPLGVLDRAVLVQDHPFKAGAQLQIELQAPSREGLHAGVAQLEIYRFRLIVPVAQRPDAHDLHPQPRDEVGFQLAGLLLGELRRMPGAIVVSPVLAIWVAASAQKELVAAEALAALEIGGADAEAARQAPDRLGTGEDVEGK